MSDVGLEQVGDGTGSGVSGDLDATALRDDFTPPSATSGGPQQILYGGRSNPFGDNVKISTPESITPTVCSNCAESDRSRVTAVQPSDSTFTWARPRLIMGSTVNSMPGLNTMPSPRRPTWTMLGSSWNRRPSP